MRRAILGVLILVLWCGLAQGQARRAVITPFSTTDGNKGDITVSGGGTVWTINPDSIELATDTVGPYVSTVTPNQGLVCTGTEPCTVGLLPCAAGLIPKSTGTTWVCAADATGAGGSDSTAIHRDQGDEFALIPDKSVLVPLDRLLLEDSQSAPLFAKRDTTVSGLVAALESLLTLANIPNAVTDTQVPNTITLDSLVQITSRSATLLTSPCADTTVLGGTTGGGVECQTDDDVPESGDFGAALALEPNGALSPNVVGAANMTNASHGDGQWSGGNLTITNVQCTGSCIADAEVDNNITATNYLPLTGGILTGALTLDILGVIGQPTDTNPPCSPGMYRIYPDDSEDKWKKCENGVLSDMDTGGVGGAGDLMTIGACTTGDCAIAGGNDIFPLLHEGVVDAFETTITVTNPTVDRTITFPDASGEVSLLGQTIAAGELDSASVRDQLELVLRLPNLQLTLPDAKVDDNITVSNYLPLVGGTMTGQLVTDNLGIRYEASDTNPACTTGLFVIYADDDEDRFKKCQNGVLSDLDTGGAGGGGDVTTAVSLATSVYTGDANFGRCEWAAGGEVFSVACNAAKTATYTSDIVLFADDMHIRNVDGDTCHTIDSVTGLIQYNTTGNCARPQISRPFDASAFNVGTGVTRETVTLNGWGGSPVLIGPDSDAGLFSLIIESLWNDYVSAGAMTLQLNCHSITSQAGLLAVRVGASVCTTAGEALPAYVAPTAGSLLTCQFNSLAHEVQRSNTVSLTTTGCAAGEKLSIPLVTEADTTATWSLTQAMITGGLLTYETAGPAGNLGPTTALLDNCNRTEAPLSNGGFWAAGNIDSDETGTIEATGATCAKSAVAGNGTVYSAATYGPNAEAYMTFAATPTTGTNTVYVRLANAGTAIPDGIGLFIDHAADTMTIVRVDDGVGTALPPAVSQVMSAGDTVILRAVGTSISALYCPGGVNCQVRLTRSEAAYNASGRIGYRSTVQANAIDSLGGGSLP